MLSHVILHANASCILLIIYVIQRLRPDIRRNAARTGLWKRTSATTTMKEMLT